MAERRTLAAGMNVVPHADPEAVRRFITQESAPSVAEPQPAPARNGPEISRVEPAQSPPPPRRSALKPVGLIPVTVRLRPEIAGGLKRASLERQLAGLSRPSGS